MWKITKTILEAVLKRLHSFLDKVRLGRDYNFRSVAPLLTSFKALPGGEQYGYIFSDGRKSDDVYKIVPGYFHSCFPRHYDQTRRSSYIPPVGTSNAWKNSLTIANSVPNGHIIVFLDPQDNIAESLFNLSSYNIDPERLFVFVDTDGKVQQVDTKTGTIAGDIDTKTFPQNMGWLAERIKIYQQNIGQSHKTTSDYHTLVVGCADKRKNTMFDLLFPNKMGFEHLRYPGGFLREKGVSATTGPIVERYKNKKIILINHTECVAVKEVSRGIMQDPVIKHACDILHNHANPKQVDDITAMSSRLSYQNIEKLGANTSMLQYDVATGLVYCVDKGTGQTIKDINAAEGFDIRILEYNNAVMAEKKTSLAMIG